MFRWLVISFWIIRKQVARTITFQQNSDNTQALPGVLHYKSPFEHLSIFLHYFQNIWQDEKSLFLILCNLLFYNYYLSKTT